MKQLDPKDPAEAIYYGLDFARLLGDGETLSSATASIRVTSGTDAGAASMLSGSPIISGTIVKQLIINGVAGCTYRVGVLVVTSAGQTFVEAASLRVRDVD